MTIVIYELTCPHEPSRDSYCDRDHNKRFFLFFFFSTLMETLASNSPSVVRASSVLVILCIMLVHFTRQSVERWPTTKTCRISRNILVVDTKSLEIFDIHALSIQNPRMILPEIRFKLNSSFQIQDTATWIRPMYATGVFDPRETPVE